MGGGSRAWGRQEESHNFFSLKPDRTFEIKIGQPTVSYFLKAAAGIEKGARNTGKGQAGHLGFWGPGRKQRLLKGCLCFASRERGGRPGDTEARV